MKCLFLAIAFVLIPAVVSAQTSEDSAPDTSAALAAIRKLQGADSTKADKQKKGPDSSDADTSGSDAFIKRMHEDAEAAQISGGSAGEDKTSDTRTAVEGVRETAEQQTGIPTTLDSAGRAVIEKVMGVPTSMPSAIEMILSKYGAEALGGPVGAFFAASGESSTGNRTLDEGTPNEPDPQSVLLQCGPCTVSPLKEQSLQQQRDAYQFYLDHKEEIDQALTPADPVPVFQVPQYQLPTRWNVPQLRANPQPKPAGNPPPNQAINPSSTDVVHGAVHGAGTTCPPSPGRRVCP